MARRGADRTLARPYGEPGNGGQDLRTLYWRAFLPMSGGPPELLTGLGRAMRIATRARLQFPNRILELISEGAVMAYMIVNRSFLANCARLPA